MHTPRCTSPDLLSELFSIASALHFVEDALNCHADAETHVHADGAAFVAGLLGSRIHTIADTLWTQEDAAGQPPRPSEQQNSPLT